MSTFYLLPPRECLEKAVADLFAKLLPGLPLPADAWDAVAEQLGTAAGWANEVFLIPRDELPEGAAAKALADGYGAEPGDRVVEVRLAHPARTWSVEPSDVSSAAPAR